MVSQNKKIKIMNFDNNFFFSLDGQEVAIVITRSQLNTVSKFVEVILEKKIESALAIERSCDQQHSSQRE